MKVEKGLRLLTSLGLFIGRGGANLRRLQARTKTHIYQDREASTWFVYYDEVPDLEAVKRAMR